MIRTPPFALPLLLGGAAILACSCAVAPKTPRIAPGDAPTVGIYRGRVSDEQGRSRRFRLLLFAAMPDRMRGEVVSALGRTELILDTGDGRLSVALVRERVAFVGPAEAEFVGRVLGVPISAGELVAALLTGRAGAGPYSYERSPGEGLPREFRLEGNGRALQMELKRFQGGSADRSALGTGAPPPGFELRDLAELEWNWFEAFEEPRPDRGPEAAR